ncbi:MAG: polymer-forming cytoskeletal protein [Methanosarcinales archaeon]|nr:polymer-forming cytoskeletal protein [Methanosarcinales archaeon]
MLDLQTFVIPNRTTMEEHTVVVGGGVCIGGDSTIEYGIIADGIATGEHVEIRGEVSARSEIYIDRWSEIFGAVHVDGDAHLGEFTKIHGKLVVSGDLDIGNHVSVEDGFEAKGWITIKNPISVIIFLYMYLSEMLRLGRGEEAEKMLEELFCDSLDEIDEQMMIVPAKSKITFSTIETDRPMRIGDGCRLQGNIRAESLSLGTDTTLFGGIVAGEVTVHEMSTIHGSINAKANVRIGKGSHVLGDVRARTINIHRSARVDGTMDAPRGIVIDEADDAPYDVDAGGESGTGSRDRGRSPDQSRDRERVMPEAGIASAKRKSQRTRLSRSSGSGRHNSGNKGRGSSGNNRGARGTRSGGARGRGSRSSRSGRQGA